jgi:hypothetical protein
MNLICHKYKHISTGIICATISLGVIYFVRKYRASALQKLIKSSACRNNSLSGKVAVVNSFTECQIVGRTLQRLVVFL